MEELVIIGAGPAGYTAAIYAARAQLEPVVIGGNLEGGQLMLTTEVENFPGFPEGIMGPQLMMNCRKQAERFGTKMVSGMVNKVDFSGFPLIVETDNGDRFETKSVIIATGASARWLNLENEEKYRGVGVSSCATCDGFFFKGKEVIVVGAGDSAMEEANFLTKFATKVYVIHRSENIKASKIMFDRAEKNEKIEFMWNTEIKAYHGEEKLEAVTLHNTKTDETSEMKIDGVFMAIGHTPNTKPFEGHIELDDHGYIVPDDVTSTSVKGVFVAGDVEDIRYRQAITAAGSGCKAAMDAEKYLEGLE